MEHDPYRPLSGFSPVFTAAGTVLTLNGASVFFPTQNAEELIAQAPCLINPALQKAKLTPKQTQQVHGVVSALLALRRVL